MNECSVVDVWVFTLECLYYNFRREEIVGYFICYLSL